MNKKILVIILVMLFTFFNVHSTYCKYSSSYHKKITLNNRMPLYCIKYNSNGGIGTMEDLELRYGISKNLSKNIFVNGDYTFLEWSTNIDGTGIKYQDEELVNNLTKVDNTCINLYANWVNYHIYFQLPPDWGSDNVSVYLYNDLKGVYNAPWPGIKATLIDEDKKIYSYLIEKDKIDEYSNIIFTDTTDGVTTKQTIDLEFSNNDLGKILVPSLYSNDNKIRIFVYADPNISPEITLWNNRPFPRYKYTLGKKISGGGYEWIIDLDRFNKFKLSWKQVSTDTINVPIYQDLTYQIGVNTHSVSRFYYDGIWTNYDNWKDDEFYTWYQNDYHKYLEVPSNYN